MFRLSPSAAVEFIILSFLAWADNKPVILDGVDCYRKTHTDRASFMKSSAHVLEILFLVNSGYIESCHGFKTDYKVFF
jgi:hypothetical protein